MWGGRDVGILCCVDCLVSARVTASGREAVTAKGATTVGHEAAREGTVSRCEAAREVTCG